MLLASHAREQVVRACVHVCVPWAQRVSTISVWTADMAHGTSRGIGTASIRERGGDRAQATGERERERGIERENPRADKCDDTHTPAGCYTTTSDDTELNQTNRCDSTHTSRVLDDQVAARAPLPRY